MPPKIRQTIYGLGTILSAGLGIALVWGGIGSDAANSVNQVLAGVLALLGAGAPAVAAGTVAKQRKDGTLDSQPPADAAITAIQETVRQAGVAAAEVDRVKVAVSDALGQVPVLGPLAKQVIDSIRLP